VTTRLVLLLSVIFTFKCGKGSSHLRLATTTNVDNSGLLQAILSSLRQETGIEVQVLAVGSGRAVELLRRGDADLALLPFVIPSDCSTSRISAARPADGR
jgi:tungstate transport system substrate-binding protein